MDDSQILCSANSTVEIPNKFVIKTSPISNDEHQGCPNNYFICKDLSCVLHSKVYNGVEDCLDGSDETVFASLCWLKQIHPNYASKNQMPGNVSECNICHAANCSCAMHYFQCESGGCTLWGRVCDTMFDCSDSSDERSCLEVKSPPTYIQLSHDLHPATSVRDKNNLTFYCENSRISIPVTWLNDGIPDCDVITSRLVVRNHGLVHDMKWDRHIEDENIHVPIKKFDQQNLLFCSDRRHHTFPFLALCQFDYDHNRDIKYCRSGEHLRYCADIQCQGRYKCPGSYCLSISRLCDSVMDCPHGEDEMNCHNCTVHCPGMIRCKTGHCIHPRQLCDGQSDCPGNDEDESLCDTVLCPKECSCVGQSMSCNTSSLELLVGDMKHVKLFDSFVLPTMSNTGHLYFVNASHGKIQLIDVNHVGNMQSVVILDLSFNEINIINDEAFINMIMLKRLLLSNNMIHTLPPRFTGAKQSLHLIDLAFNYISEYNVKALYNQQHLAINLSSNKLDTIDFAEVTEDNLVMERQLDVRGNTILNVKNFIFVLHRLDMYVDSDYFQCAWNKSVRNTTIDRQSTCSLAMQTNFKHKPLLYTIGSIAIIINSILLVTNSRSIKFTSTGMISLNNLYIVNVLMGVSELMMVSKDDVFVIGTAAETRGGKHVWCLVAGFLQYASVGMVLPLCTVHMYGMYCCSVQWIALKAGKLILLVSVSWVITAIFGLISVIYDLGKDVQSLEIVISPSCSYYLSGYSIVMTISLYLQLLVLLPTVISLLYFTIKLHILTLRVKAELESSGGKKIGKNQTVLLYNTILLVIVPFSFAVLQLACVSIGLAETTSDNESALILIGTILPIFALITPIGLFLLKIKHYIWKE